MRATLKQGLKVGLWTLTERIPGGHRSHPKWNCLCACGTQRVVDAEALAQGKSKSCGCGPKRTTKTHGMSRDPIIGVWRNIVSRCTKPEHRSYKNYGGRGVTVCEHWLSFDNFLADVGPHPGKGLTIERVDNNGNYEPGNVAWATRKVQARNKRSTVQVEIDDRKQCLQDWATEIGVTPHHLYRRMQKGMTPQQAIEDVRTNPPKVRGPYRVSKTTRRKVTK